MNPLALIQLASQLVALAANVIPQIEANLAEGKTIAGQTDPATINAEITQLHQDTLALTAKLDALKSAA